MKPTTQESEWAAWIAWAAGLYEGEGCIYLNNGYPRLTLGMTDEEPVLWFAQIVEIGFYGPHDNGPNKPSWSATTSDRTAIERIQTMMAPYLSPRRTEQFERVMRDARDLVRGIPTGVPPCGRTVENSQRGYKRHLWHKEIPCDPCRLAYNEYKRTYERNRKDHK